MQKIELESKKAKQDKYLVFGCSILIYVLVIVAAHLV
jgi:hypothetical protein